MNILKQLEILLPLSELNKELQNMNTLIEKIVSLAKWLVNIYWYNVLIEKYHYTVIQEG